MKSVMMLSLVLTIMLLAFGYVLAEVDMMKPKLQITCPVMRGQNVKCTIDKDFYTNYKGKRIYFCYKDCIEEFWENPEKYIKILEGDEVTLEKAPAGEPKNSRSTEE